MFLILITYLAGVLTILSPCILPVLPFVFSRSQGSFLKNGLPLLAGMCLTFSAFSAVAIVGGEWVSHANVWGRWIAMALLSLFAASLIFPSLSERLVAPLTRAGSRIGNSPGGPQGIGGSILVGVSTGLLWAPCAGPILGLVLTGAASQGNLGRSIVLLVSYSLGAATSLALALVAGNRFLGKLKKFLGVDRVVKRVLGVAVLLGVIAIFFDLDRTVLTRFSKVETVSLENKLLALSRSGDEKAVAPVMGEMPELSGAVLWLNSKPLTKADLKGKVVLVDFWTYSCINCLRTLPYVKAWEEKYRADGLVVIGVHAPEFAFERSEQNVRKAVSDLGITYPVALDNDFKIWRSFQNEYWPAHYFIDRKGMIRHTHFGEGEYEESEKTVRNLLMEDGTQLSAKSAAKELTVNAAGVQAAGAFVAQQSPETYLGYGRAKSRVTSPALVKDREAKYGAHAALQVNEWSVEGRWNFSKESATSGADSAKIQFRYRARDLHLVLGGAKPVRFRVTIDGKPPGTNHGLDTDENGMGQVRGQRLYQLIRAHDSESTDHLFEIEFLDPGVQAYAFTFG